MDALRDWAVSICVTGICSTVVLTLSPSGALEKTLKVVATVFMICCIAVPLAGNIALNGGLAGIKSGGAVEIDAAAVNDSVEKSVVEEARRRLILTAKELLEKSGEESPAVGMDLTVEENEIRIDEIYIRLPEKEGRNMSGIYSAFYNTFGVKPVVKVGERE